MTTINENDFKKLLLSHNFRGDIDGLDQTDLVPGQTLNQVNGENVITYSFFQSQSDIINSVYFGASDEEVLKFIDPADYQQNIVDSLKSLFAPGVATDPRYIWFQEVANIIFVETTIGTNDLDSSGSIDSSNEYTTGMIAVGQLDDSYSNFMNGFFADTSAIALPFNPKIFPESPELKSSDIFFNPNAGFWDDPILLKSQQFKVLMEEILHSLGVDVKGSVAEGTYLDSQKYTVTAYASENAPGMRDILFTGDVIAPHTLQILDIAALQAIYGPKMNAFPGDTNYTLSVMNPSANDSAFLYTIWDGQGNDTIDASASTVSAEIDLREGHFSSIGRRATGLLEIRKDVNASIDDPDPGNVAIAFGTVIENATGTSHDDHLIGNDANNILKGGEGNDTLKGGRGHDTADYSDNAAAGGKNGVSVTLDSNGNGSATDGFGDTDTLSSIENLTLTDFVDHVTLDGPAGRMIDAGAGKDSVTYQQSVVEDRNTGDADKAVIWDLLGQSRDDLNFVEEVEFNAGVILPDYGRDSRVAVQHQQNELINDYSAHNGGVRFDFTQFGKLGFFTFRGVDIWQGSRGAIVEVDLGGGITHRGSASFSGQGYSTANVLKDMGLGGGSVNPIINIVGTNSGDTVSINSFAQNVQPPAIFFRAGNGNDTITFDAGFSGLGSIAIGFRGGLDVVENAGALDSIEIWEGITRGDVKITQVGGNTVLDAGTFGSLTLEGVTTAPTIIWAEDFNSTIEGTWGVDFWTSRADVAETFYGKGGGDTLTANGGDTIFGGGGIDGLQSIATNGLGTNTLLGGDGDDSYIVSHTAETVITDTQGSNQVAIAFGFNLADLGWEVNNGNLELFDDSAGGHRLFATLTTPENFSKVSVIGSPGSSLNVSEMMDGAAQKIITSTSIDVINASTFTAPVFITLGGGNDRFTGTDFDDTVDGQSGDDIAFGGAGNDSFSDSSGNDFYSGGVGDDSFSFSRFSASTPLDTVTLDGGLGYDIYNLDDNNLKVIIRDADSANRIFISDISSADVSFSIAGDDLLFTASGDSEAFITIQNASVMQGTEISFLFGPTFLISDILAGMPIPYSFSGGDDVVDMSLSTVAFTTMEVGGLPVGAQLHGGDNQFTGTLFADTVFGGNGVDIISGNDGNDLLMGENGDDTLNGDLGNDVLDGGTGGDTLNGGEGDDTLIGGSDNDTLIGGGGNDTLIGGAGKDILKGGAGNDIYVFRPGDDIDTIIDTEGTNTLRIEGNLDVSDLNLVQVGNDLVIDIASGVVLQDFFLAGTSSIIDNLEFRDAGTVVNITTLPVSVNQAPVAQNDSFTTLKEVGLSGNVFADNGNGVDFDPENNPLTIQTGLFFTAAQNIIEIRENGDFFFSSQENFSGQDSFTYTISDSRGGENTATVSIDVTSDNNGPVALDDSFIGEFGDVITGNLLVDNGNGADFDVDGDTLSVQATMITTVQGGSVEILANGDFTYTPAILFSGNDSFEYTLLDGQDGSDVGNVNVTVEESINEIVGTTGRDNLQGTENNDVIRSLGGSIDRMSGKAGTDIFVFGEETLNGIRERDIILDYEVGIDSILLEDDASIGSIRPTSSGVAIFFEGDRDAAYVQGEGVLVGNLTFVPDDILLG